ncbi:uncharacterized protein EV422DRAFT_196907 [Fimicolochytrium jonesii]|uniref:uncharacterized protein n=1 Tax=Fimicolochytrium jonesii TaxID=1396493 RepID=UPI0022FF0E0B|nr:uncharacterized protein EV422DRAFT_196907 [Fimicolochytrium jonesii]KAI8817903.1 hypothetical protein EV422DRAFT_196907 [Fimicolochytrium jonesii]
MFVRACFQALHRSFAATFSARYRPISFQQIVNRCLISSVLRSRQTQSMAGPKDPDAESSNSQIGPQDIEDAPPWKAIHDEAVEAGKDTYKDPGTGYSVFTELSHKKRGYCCGNACRHCPFDRENVGKPEKIREQAAAMRKLRKARRSSSDGSDSSE